MHDRGAAHGGFTSQCRSAASDAAPRIRSGGSGTAVASAVTRWLDPRVDGTCGVFAAPLEGQPSGRSNHWRALRATEGGNLKVVNRGQDRQPDGSKPQLLHEAASNVAKVSESAT
jgi:hypothetical protein